MKAFCRTCDAIHQVPFGTRDRPPCPDCGTPLTAPRKERKATTKPPRAISPASEAQRAAAALATRCTACGKPRARGRALDPAHLAKRGRYGGCDDPLCTPFDLCRNVFSGEGCHRDFDEGRLDMLRVVSAEPDRYRAALQHALEHMTVVELIERLAGARTQWSDAA